jgi:hypothetical protein
MEQLQKEDKDEEKEQIKLRIEKKQSSVNIEVIDTSQMKPPLQQLVNNQRNNTVVKTLELDRRRKVSISLLFIFTPRFH